jgi:hypothetical protein
MSHLYITDAQAGSYPPALANAEALRFIMRALSWLPGNLFIGPGEEYRVLDPSDALELHSRTVMGFTPDQMRIACNLDTLLAPKGNRDFGSINTATWESPGSSVLSQTSAQTETCRFVEQLIAATRVRPFDASRWEEALGYFPPPSRGFKDPQHDGRFFELR